MELVNYENSILHIKLGSVDYWYKIPQHLYEELVGSNNKPNFFMTRIDGLYEYFKRNPHTSSS